MQERWDVVLRCLNGPMSAMGDQTLRGPVVRIGANPGPGGLKLNGYRGLDARHAVITAYDKATASIAPVGTSQIRMAPHPNVRWQDIDPIPGPQYLSQGCALHLGPVGRGATLEFVRIQKLGVWEQGLLASANEQDVQSGVAKAGSGVVAQGTGAPPASYQARRVTRISASTVPLWFAGGLLVMSTLAVTCIGAVFLAMPKGVQPVGPVAEGQDSYDYVTIATEDLNPALVEGLRQGFHDFVMKPSGDAADNASVRRQVTSPESWDAVFYDHVARYVQTQAEAWAFFRRLDAIKDHYGFVVKEMRDADLPEVFAGIPYQESRYQPDEQSIVCAKGWWQFMPEVAHRLDMTVRDCRFTGTDGTWSPTGLAPPPTRSALYVDNSGATQTCRIPRQNGCAIDRRTDLDASTAGAVRTLGEAWQDSTLRASGAIVAMTIASHNAGYDDGRYGVPKNVNILPAYTKWAQRVPGEERPNFYGANLTTTTPEEPWNGSVLWPETQHYVYRIVGAHLIAVCYYAINHGTEEPFREWVKYTREEGYCRNLRVPTLDEVRRR
jgi:hypothetical protein